MDKIDNQLIESISIENQSYGGVYMTELVLNQNELRVLSNVIQGELNRIAGDKSESYQYMSKGFLNFCEQNSISGRDAIFKYFTSESKSISRKETLRALLKQIAKNLDSKERLFFSDEIDKIWNDAKKQSRKLKSKNRIVRQDKKINETDYIKFSDMSRIVRELWDDPITSKKYRTDPNKNKKYSLMIQFLFITGIRISELIEIRLDETTHGKQKTFLLIHGKGDKNRTVFIPEKLFKQINKYFQGETYLFETVTNRLYNRMNLYKTLVGIFKKMGHDRIHPHSLRHSCAMWLLNDLKWDVKTVSEYLGHQNTSITLDTYLHEIISENIDSLLQNVIHLK
jgi:integrase